MRSTVPTLSTRRARFALGAWVAAAIAAAGCKTTHGDAEGTGGSGVVADGGAGGQPGGTGGAP
ncbi:MAG TPA: di-heme enzyme, partial [Polyangia bacterium]|nr:di-heme enzyme [Polyangia bacterium]